MSEEVGIRISLCKSCDRLNSLNFCKECGCFMPAKVRLKWSECPLKKWKAVADAPFFAGLKKVIPSSPPPEIPGEYIYDVKTDSYIRKG